MEGKMFLLEIDEETIYACANMEAYLSRIEERISFELNEVTKNQQEI